jgi:hypothetical protein
MPLCNSVCRLSALRSVFRPSPRKSSQMRIRRETGGVLFYSLFSKIPISKIPISKIPISKIPISKIPIDESQATTS